MMGIEYFLGVVHCGDAEEIMAGIPDASVGLVVTSPPYNLRNTMGGGFPGKGQGLWSNAALKQGYSDHDDKMPYDEYVAWQRRCLREMMRVLKEDGAIFYNHKWRVQGGLL